MVKHSFLKRLRELCVVKTNGFMDSRLGGRERLALYGEAITKMAETPEYSTTFPEYFKRCITSVSRPRNPESVLKRD